MTLVTRDATSGIWYPATGAEVTSLYSGRGIGAPVHGYNCQDAAGNLADFIGSVPLVKFNAPTYHNAVPGHARLAIGYVANNDCHFVSPVAAGDVGDISNVSSAVLLFGAAAAGIGAPPPVAIKDIINFGASPNDRHLQWSASSKFQIVGTGQATGGGTATPGSGVHPLIFEVNRTGAAFVAQSDQETLAPAYTAPAGGSAYLSVGPDAVGDAGQTTTLVTYMLMWAGAAAEFTIAQRASIIDCHLNGPAVTSIAVTPTSFSLAPLATQQMVAIATRADGSTYDCSATATWLSSDPTKATVSATGLVTAIAVGTSNITAAFTSLNAATATSPAQVVTVTGGPPPVLYLPPVLFDPVPGNIGLIGDSMVRLELAEPQDVQPSDSARNLNDLAPAKGIYPVTAATFAAAVDYGTWSNGWLFDAVSGGIPAAFGATALAALSTPVYSLPGPLGTTDLSVGFDSANDGFSAGNIDNPGANDFCLAWVAKFTAAPVNSDIMIKTIGASNLELRTIAGAYRIDIGDGTTNLFCLMGALAPVGAWHVGILVVDRAAGTMRLAQINLDGTNAFTSAAVSIATLGAVTNTGALIFGSALSTGAFGSGAPLQLNLAAAFVGSGAGAATGMSANLATAIANLRKALSAAVAPTAVTFCGRGRAFSPGFAFDATDVVPGASLSTRDVTVQAILNWDFVGQNTYGHNGTILARGKGTAAAEYVAYALELLVVDFANRVGELRMWWQDNAGAVHLETGGEFTVPDGFVLYTATRRWESTGRVVIRYYAADQMLAEVVTVDGDIGGGTTGTFTLGASSYTAGLKAYLCGTLDDLRIVHYEMSAEEVRETWRRLFIHQPNGVAMFAGLTPPGSGWYDNPGNNIGRLVKIAGQSLGLGIAKIEDLRARWLPDACDVDTIARWERTCGLSPRPRDSLDVRRARVIAYLSRIRGYSLPALQQAFANVFLQDASAVQILEFSNRIDDAFTAAAVERWNYGDGVMTVAYDSGTLLATAPNGTDLRWDPTRTQSIIRTPISSAGRNVALFPSGPRFVAQGRLDDFWTLLPVGVIAGLCVQNRIDASTMWFGAKNVAGVIQIGYQIFAGAAMGAFVTLLTPALHVPYWLRLRPPTGTGVFSIDSMLVGYSTTGPTTGFTEVLVNTGIDASWAGFAACSDAAIASAFECRFDDFVLLSYNGDRPFNWYAYRDPAITGTPDIVGAELLALKMRPAHTYAAAVTSKSVLCDDPRDGLCDRGPMGAL